MEEWSITVWSGNKHRRANVLAGAERGITRGHSSARKGPSAAGKQYEVPTLCLALEEPHSHLLPPPADCATRPHTHSHLELTHTHPETPAPIKRAQHSIPGFPSCSGRCSKHRVPPTPWLCPSYSLSLLKASCLPAPQMTPCLKKPPKVPQMK